MLRSSSKLDTSMRARAIRVAALVLVLSIGSATIAFAHDMFLKIGRASCRERVLQVV